MFERNITYIKHVSTMHIIIIREYIKRFDKTTKVNWTWGHRPQRMWKTWLIVFYLYKNVSLLYTHKLITYFHIRMIKLNCFVVFKHAIRPGKLANMAMKIWNQSWCIFMRTTLFSCRIIAIIKMIKRQNSMAWCRQYDNSRCFHNTVVRCRPNINVVSTIR